MMEGDVVLTSVAQADGRSKNRPVVVLRQLPPFGDVLVCGMSTQLHQEVVGFDEVIFSTDADFAASGLAATSLVRLGFLSVLPTGKIIGRVGSISPERHQRLLHSLAEYLVR